MGVLAVFVYSSGFPVTGLAGEVLTRTEFGQTPLEGLAAADELARPQATNAAFMAVAHATAALAAVAAMIAKVFLPHGTAD